MRLHEIAGRKDNRMFQDWQTEERLHFDERGKLVNKDGAYITVTRELLLKDWEIVCAHPESKRVFARDSSSPSGIEIRCEEFAIRCEECDQPLVITGVRAKPAPHANIPDRVEPKIPERPLGVG